MNFEFDDELFTDYPSKIKADNRSLTAALGDALPTTCDGKLCFEATVAAPCWFMLPSGSLKNNETEDLAAHLKRRRHRAAYLYLKRDYAKALHEYQLLLSHTPENDRSARLEYVESVARCHLEAGDPSAALKWAMCMLALGRNSDHEIQACYLMLRILREAGEEKMGPGRFQCGEFWCAKLEVIILTLLISGGLEKNEELWTALGACFQRLSTSASPSLGAAHPFSLSLRPDCLPSEDSSNDVDSGPTVCNDAKCQLDDALEQLDHPVFANPVTASRLACACWVRAKGLLELARKDATAWALTRNRNRTELVCNDLKSFSDEHIAQAQTHMCPDIIRMFSGEQQGDGQYLYKPADRPSSVDFEKSSAKLTFKESAAQFMRKWFDWLDSN